MSPPERDIKDTTTISKALSLFGYVGRNIKKGFKKVASIWSKEETPRSESATKKDDSQFKIVLPHWVQNTISPWVYKKHKNKQKFESKITTLRGSRAAVSGFWKEKMYDVVPFEKVTVCNRDRTTTIAVAPGDKKECETLFCKTIKLQKKYAILTPIEMLKEHYLANMRDISVVFIERPVSFVKLNHNGASMSSESTRYVWVTKGLDLPYRLMSTDGSGIIANHSGTACWKYRKDKLVCVRATDEQGRAAMMVSHQKNSSVSQEICKLIASENAKEACSGLERAAAAVAHTSQDTLRPVEVLKALNVASKHLGKTTRIHGAYSCSQCGCRSPTTLTPCAERAFSLCNKVLQSGGLQCGIRRTALAMIKTHLYGAYNPHSVSNLVVDGLISQTIEPSAPERKVWVESCSLIREMMASSSYQRVWTALVNKYNSLTTPQSRVKVFLERALKEESEHLADTEESLVRQSFFANIQMKLKQKGLVDTSLPQVSGSQDTGEWRWAHTHEPALSTKGKTRILSWNVNGLKRRWLTGSFKKVITEAGFPEVLTLQETKCTETTARRMKGFVEFLHSNGYRVALWHTSSDSKKGNAGYAGVATLTRIPVEDHVFGMDTNSLQCEARVLTTVHAQFSLVNTYVPNSGGMGDNRSLESRLVFDKELRAHITSIQQRFHRPCIWVGDINVAPYPGDYHPAVFRMIPSKWPQGEEPSPGFLPSISKEEIESYHKTTRDTGLVNLWDAMGCTGNSRTWYPRNTVAARTKGFGARLDHIHGPASLVDVRSPFYCASIQNLWSFGNSDHTPLMAEFITGTEVQESAPALQNDTTQCVERLCGIALPQVKNAYSTFTKIVRVLSRVYPRDAGGVEPLEINAKEVAHSEPAVVANEASNEQAAELCLANKAKCDYFQDTFDPHPTVADFVPQSLSLVAEPAQTLEKDPMPYMKMCWHCDEQREEVDTLIDSGSYFDLIHQDLAAKLLKKGVAQIVQDQKGTELPRLRSANGGLNSALAKVRLKMSLPDQEGDFLTERDVLVFRNLPVDAILGAKTCQLLRACLDWEKMEWRSTSMQGDQVTAKLTVKDTERYRSADVMVVHKKVTIYPGEHRRIATRLEKKAAYQLNGIDVDDTTECLRTVSPLRNTHHSGLKVPWGITQKGDWMQVANLGITPVFLQPGDALATAQHMSDSSYELRSDSNIDNIDSGLYKSADALPSDLVCTCAHNWSEKDEKESKHVSEHELYRKNSGDNHSHLKRKMCPAVNNACDPARGDNLTSEKRIVPSMSGVEVGGNMRSTEAIADSEKSANSANGSANINEMSKRVCTENSSGKALNNVKRRASVMAERSKFCMVCSSQTKAQWKKTVSKMSMTEIDAELKKEPLNTVDLDVARKLLVKADFAKLKRWVVTRKATFMDGPFTPVAAIHKTRLVIETPAGDPGHRAYPDRHNPSEYEIIQKQVDEWLKNKVIQESISPWSSNIVLVRKADRKARVAIDYRKLNKATKKDAYMLPRVDQVFDVMHGVQFVSITDCHSAFLQIPIDDKETREKTAFVTPDGGLYEFLRCPFGLVNAPAVWQRLIDETLVGYRWKFALAYVDDICIFTKSHKIEDHLEHLDLVFDRLDQYGLSAKASKTYLAHKELPFLGHIIGVDGIKPDPKKVSAMADAKAPHDLTSLRSTLGKFSYYRKFVKDFAKIAAPLTALLSKGPKKKKNEPYLSKEAEKAFEKLKEAMCKEPVVLAHPDWSKPFEVHTDGSKDGIGAVLCQNTDLGEQVVMYASRSTTPLEKKYKAHELEALAVVWATDIFRHYLYGKKFLIRTDHKALKWLMNRDDHTSRVMRWILKLQELDFDVQHRSGKSNAVADALSRYPLDSTEPYGEDEIEPLYYCNTDLPPKASCRWADRPLFCTTYENTAADADCFVQTRSAKAQNPANTSGHRNPEPEKGDGSDEMDGKHTEKRATTADEARTEDECNSKVNELSLIHKLLDGYIHAENRVKWFAHTMREYQKKDPVICALKRDVASGKSTKYCVENGVFKIKGPENCNPLVMQKLNLRRFVVPRALVNFIIYFHHNFLLSGHQGRARVLAAMSKRFYWKHMNDDVRKWIKSCVPCRRRKTPRPMNAGLTQPMFQGAPMHTVAIDLVGPCPETENGDLWILTMMDVFTRWPIAVPIPNREATTVMKALYEHLFCLYGMPVRILSDRGKEFIDTGLMDLCAWLGIRKITTTGYQPQANGHVERFHRYLNASMTILSRGNVGQWDKYLPAILFSYRTGVCESTGFSPYFLMFGRAPNLPIDLLCSIEPETFTSESSYSESVAEALQQAYEYARTKQQEAALKNAASRNKNRTPTTYKEGDSVFYWFDKSNESYQTSESTGERLTIPSKWRSWWQGPYKVIGRLGDSVYELELNGKRVKANVNRIIPHVALNEAIHDTSLPDWRIQGGMAEFAKGRPVISDIPVSIKPVRVGDMVAWPMKPTVDSPLPFGVGKVLDINGDKLNLQWYGNAHERAESTYRPCWFQNKLKKYYYRSGKEHKSHSPYTTCNTDTEVSTKEVIIHGFEIQPDDHLSKDCLDLIFRHPSVESSRCESTSRRRRVN